jgi:hypothetical protein
MPDDDPHRPALDAVFVRSETVVARKIAGECLLVPLARRGADLDSIYNLNRVGAFIWERIDGLKSSAAIAADVALHFDVGPEQAAADLCEFTSLLQSIGAIRAADAQTA